jgi:predicted outer membrane repeat protein
VLTISNSTIANNRAQALFGPGNVGGISNETGGTLTINDTTITGNSAIGQGGGISTGGQSVTIRNSTITGNSATDPNNGIGGGIYVGGPMTVLNTIIAKNMGHAGSDVYGNLGSQGHNLLGNPVGASGWVDTDLLHVDPLLDPNGLQNNGGPTQTIALVPGSPALGAGDPASWALRTSAALPAPAASTSAHTRPALAASSSPLHPR